MSKLHPRFIHYPQHESYYNMYPVYRPFIFWVNEPLFKSPYVNTDDNGLRHNYLPDGRLIELNNLKADFEQCDVILGGSTVFGVDASSDKETISYHVSEDNVPCINLGNRGATSYQELLLFMFYQPYFPKIRNIYLVSGVNNCSLASLEGSIVYDEFGGIFGQDYYMTMPYMSNLSVCYDDLSYNRLRLYNAIERRYRDYSLFRKMIRLFVKKAFKVEPIKNSMADNRKSFEKKMEQLLINFDNEFKIWSALAQQHGSQLFYFLQPCMFWNNKQISEIEKECYNADLKIYPVINLYANSEFHKKYATTIARLSQKHNILFYDCNEAIDNVQKDVTVFTDVCHLTDAGNKLVADYINNKKKQ